MMQKIKERKEKRQEHLKILKSAIEDLDVTDRAYAHIDGRIREVENELNWLIGKN